MLTHRMTALIGTATLAVVPLAMAAPAAAVEKNFRYAGAEVEFEAEKERGKFEVSVDLDRARSASRWRVTLWHDGKRFHRQVHTANRTGDLDVKKLRPNTAGKDVFTMKIYRLGADRAAVRTIRLG